MRRPHRVPLAPRAVAILLDLQAITGRVRFLFPSVRSATRCMSENTINAALRRLGFRQDELRLMAFVLRLPRSSTRAAFGIRTPSSGNWFMSTTMVCVAPMHALIFGMSALG